MRDTLIYLCSPVATLLMCPQSHFIDNQLPNPEAVSLVVQSSLRALLQSSLWHFLRPSAKTANSTMHRPSYHFTVLSFSSTYLDKNISSHIEIG